MRKWFFSDTYFDILKIESFGSEELPRLHMKMLESQNFDEDMLVKPNNAYFGSNIELMFI